MQPLRHPHDGLHLLWSGEVSLSKPAPSPLTDSWVELNSPKVAQVPSLFHSPPILAAAKAHGRSPAQVLLRWATQRGLTVIPKSSSRERLDQNLRCTDFDLSEGEMKVSARPLLPRAAGALHAAG